ncbi:hypothetical protein AVEN_144450-1 [Araneus ventricosus]|uniref:Uncharacterized protein n=1 Tax=Araneus ventricosus TaxID=182803 RepID=A0A4Y2E3Q1_ARAVE|nr:hypothetical protein AVEN_144450-1 [Araneus ventricosus]
MEQGQAPKGLTENGLRCKHCRPKQEVTDDGKCPLGVNRHIFLPDAFSSYNDPLQLPTSTKIAPTHHSKTNYSWPSGLEPARFCYEHFGKAFVMYLCRKN